ncbi:unnamed protein product [Oikopleura dioica]|uniref:WH2 domain-containing protein n=1 Tax=Oikopleura dioica TaxID=34765 RepID=E4Y7V6_OIKDI|nr:unnamed protein product [Oikopleura dioica]
MEEKETVVKINPVAEQKVEIQEERKTSFTIVPRKEQLTAANRDQKKSIYESYTVTKAVHKFRNQNERPTPSQKPHIAAKPKRQGSASLQLDEQGNIVRGGSVSSTKSPSPVLTAPKQVTTMPLDQNGNIRIVDKNRTDAHAFEIPKLKPVYSSQQFQQIPQINQECIIEKQKKLQTQQPSHPAFPQQISPNYPQMDPRMSYQFIPQYQQSTAPQHPHYNQSQSMDAQQYQQYVQQHQRMMQYQQQQAQLQHQQGYPAQAQAASAFGAYQRASFRIVFECMLAQFLKYSRARACAPKNFACAMKSSTLQQQNQQQAFQNHQQPKFQPIMAQQSVIQQQQQGAAPIESVYGPSRSISESSSLARGYFPASQNNSRNMKTSVNSSMSSPSPSMSSEEGAGQESKTNPAFPFGKKLSLKKPQPRERIVTQTPREQLLNEVQSIAHARNDTASSIPTGFVKQLSQNSNSEIMPQPTSVAPVFLKPATERKLKEKKEELSTHEVLMRQISQSRTVPEQFIADGTVKENAAPPPPPAPIAPPQLKKVNVKVPP